jgi:hypothetical protein
MSDASQDVPGAAQEPASPSPKPILVIGGHALQEGISAKYVDFCGCDFASILQAQSFSDYKVVIYWPDETALELPKTFDEWKRLKNANTGWPSINPGYWSLATDDLPTPKTASASGKKGKTPAAAPVPTEEDLVRQKRLQRHERTLCYFKLQELLECIIHGQLVVCVASDRLPNEDPFRWITTTLFIEASHNRNVKEQFIYNPSAPAAFQLLSEISKSIGAWNCRFQLMVFGESLARGPREDTWQGQLEMDQDVLEGDLYRDAYLMGGVAEHQDQPVTIQAGHLNLKKEIKSMVFISGEGGLLLIPEPQTPAKLVEAVRAYMSSSSTAHCKVCGWQHDARFNDITVGERKFTLNTPQAALVGKLHVSLVGGKRMLPAKDVLEDYPTVLEVFRHSPDGKETCVALIARSYGMIGLKTS